MNCMLYRVKITRNVFSKESNTTKTIVEYYLTDAQNFGYAGINVINKIGKNIEIDDVLLMKTYKPPINEYTDGDKIYVVKIAEDMIDDNGNQKTIKYPMPVFAKNDTELYIKVKEYLKQGLSNMRLTTISETKWLWL